MIGAEMARVERIPVKYSTHPEVQAFVDREAWNLAPYCPDPPVKTARELFMQARERFGDLACIDLTIYHH
jgi:hypothetical protein